MNYSKINFIILNAKAKFYNKYLLHLQNIVHILQKYFTEFKIL